jgi:hypothetical protein
MKLKLGYLSLFLIILISLILGMLCNNVVEGMTSSNESKNLKETGRLANPKGVPKSQIPNGDEHLYILKSQIVPPVCPACPTSTNCPREKPAPPCPPCARCPEPSFDCKKVPNYQSSNEQYLPKPMLTDFSSF